ncbi:MAG TPA: tetratricopeptide repeat protein, partial [Blastocatellia bacterium]|nr:tetratricopeptide repeat protein [Blastocatellia bacterium]
TNYKVPVVMLKNFSFALIVGLLLAVTAASQEVEVDRYQVTARVDTAASAADCRAAITVINLGQSPKTKLYFRLTKMAKVTSATVNGTTATFEASEDRRVAGLNQIVVSADAGVAPNATAKVEIAYRIEAPESSPLIHIYPGEVLLAPEAVWVPMPSTVFTYYGPATAPFTLDVNVTSAANTFRGLSAGTLKSSGPTFSFEQPLNSVPFLLASNYDQPATTDAGGVKVEVYTQPGLTAAADPKATSSIIKRVSDEAGRAVDFFTRQFGPPPAGATLRIISSARANNLVVPGALVLNEQVFRRDALTESTIEAVADAAARLWTEGRARVRGVEARTGQRPRSVAFLRDSLPRYLAALYVEDRYGKEAGRDAFERMRWSYTPVAQSGRDAELGLQTIALPNYSAAIFAKGPLVLRLIAETAGRDKLLAAIKTTFAVAQTKLVTPDDFRSAVVKGTSPEVEKLFQQWFDAITEPDIIVGAPLPSDKPNSQRINLRNLGTGEVSVRLLATTASGKPVPVTVTVPSEGLVAAEIPTAEKITAVEVDPDKLLIQTNYDNDARDGDMKLPRPSPQTLFNQSIAAFNKGDYAEAEGKLREAARRDPTNALIHAWLARALAAEKKFDEATGEANAAIKVEPPVGSALAWAHVTLGQAALARNQAAEAVAALRRAIVEAEEAPAQFAARSALIQAERAANQLPPVDTSIRSFITQLDAVIKDPSSDKLTPLIVRNNLKRFIQGLTLARPSAWATEIQRVDTLDANRVAVDVGLTARAENRDQSGTALYILSRVGGNWVLEDVQLFNVK